MYVFRSREAAIFHGFKVWYFDQEYNLYLVIKTITKNHRLQNIKAFARP